MSQPSCLVAFSGGLDTSFCILYLRELGYRVGTVTFDCGNVAPDERGRIEARSKQCGAESHTFVDARADLARRVLAPLIRADALKGGNYPYCVGAERGLQAEGTAKLAKEHGYDAVCHGSTGAGNDQVRFDVTLRAILGESFPILTPIRTHGLSREETTRRLEAAGIPVEAKTTQYSINTSLWGTTLGGGPTHDPSQPIPRDLRHRVLAAEDVTEPEREVTIGFSEGLPCSVDGTTLSLVEAIENLNAIGAAHGLGRDVHTGDTVLGIKGRVVFEAPGALLIRTAHRELNKLVLSKQQISARESLTSTWGHLMHEGLWLDPVMRDIEAYFLSEQQPVCGEVTLRLGKGTLELVRLDSPNSRMKGKAQYGEAAHGWDGRDAEGFAKVFGLQLRGPK